jgi:hypothetical protein
MLTEKRELKLTLNICSSLSLISSCVICLKYLYFPALRSRSAKLVMWLSLSNIGLSLSIICGINQALHKDEINTFAFLINFFLLCNMFWSMAITKTMALVILQRNKLLSLLSQQTVTPKSMAAKRMLSFHIVIVAGSCILSILPIACSSYASFSGKWYWYDTNNNAQIVAAVCYYVPLLLGKY